MRCSRKRSRGLPRELLDDVALHVAAHAVEEALAWMKRQRFVRQASDQRLKDLRAAGRAPGLRVAASCSPLAARTRPRRGVAAAKSPGRGSSDGASASAGRDRTIEPSVSRTLSLANSGMNFATGSSSFLECLLRRARAWPRPRSAWSTTRSGRSCRSSSATDPRRCGSRMRRTAAPSRAAPRRRSRPRSIQHRQLVAGTRAGETPALLESLPWWCSSCPRAYRRRRDGQCPRPGSAVRGPTPLMHVKLARMTDRELVRGSCLCRGVSWQVARPLKFMSHCHCSMCRKSHGSAFGTYVGASAQGYRLQGEELIGTYRSSASNARHFCTRCGSIVPNPPEGPDVRMPAGCLDDDPGVRPAAHIFVGSKATCTRSGRTSAIRRLSARLRPRSSLTACARGDRARLGPRQLLVRRRGVRDYGRRLGSDAVPLLALPQGAQRGAWNEFGRRRRPLSLVAWRVEAARLQGAGGRALHPGVLPALRLEHAA